MKYEITGKNIEITGAIEKAIKDSLDTVSDYFQNKEITAKVVARTYPVGQKVEVMLIVNHEMIARQEVLHENLYAAIDMVGHKLIKQIRKIKDRMDTSTKRRSAVADLFSFKSEEDSKNKEIIRRKVLDNKPMSEEEALLQFEISGHDFFVFEDAEVEITKILYKRKDGEYGLIEIEN